MCDYQNEKMAAAKDHCGQVEATLRHTGRPLLSRLEPDNRSITQHHSPNEVQITQIANIRLAAEHFLNAIDANCPRCADSADAKRKVREAMMTANASIVLSGAI